MSMRGTVAAIVVAILTGSAWLALSGTSADRTLAGAYSAALEEAPTRWELPGQPASLVLSRFAEAERPLAGRTLAIGDRISIATSGQSDVFEVVALEIVDGSSIGMPGLRLQIVTGRTEVGGGDGVKFIFGIEGSGAPTAPRRERSL